jgi:hypothetical protein
VTPPTCLYCGRLYSDPRGCDWIAGDPKPPAYGTECHPLSIGATCHDCGSPKGTEHHAYCLATECTDCHRQWHPGLSCSEDAELTTGTAA